MIRLTVPARRAAAALVVSLAVACGGDSGGSPAATVPTTPTVPATPAPVSSVSITSSAAAMHMAETRQLVAAVSDAAGQPLAGRTVTWSSSATSVLTVSATGLATAVGAGTATVTAASEGKQGSITLVVVAPAPAALVPFLRRPFTGEYANPNIMDHDPVAANGVVVPSWGESGTWGYEGHNGFDFGLTIGTPVLAAADGQVQYVGFDPGCATSRIVTIDHVASDGGRYRTGYLHLSRQDVTVGQTVKAGQQIALSGDTGQGICSSGPHLHFMVWRTEPNGVLRLTDPWGWTGTQADPFIGTTTGTSSPSMLWLTGEAPPMFWRHALSLFAGVTDAQITAVQWAGIDDAHNPNNEYVEVSFAPRSSTDRFALGGWTLRNNRSETFTFPADAALTAAAPVARVYSGAGVSTGVTFYWGRTSGAWLNGPDECVRLESNGFRNGSAAGYTYTHAVSFWMTAAGFRSLWNYFGTPARCITAATASAVQGVKVGETFGEVRR